MSLQDGCVELLNSAADSRSDRSPTPCKRIVPNGLAKSGFSEADFRALQFIEQVLI